MTSDTRDPAPVAPSIATTVRCFRTPNKGANGYGIWAMTTETRGVFHHGDKCERQIPGWSVALLIAGNDLMKPVEITPDEALAELAYWPEAQADLRKVFSRHPAPVEQAAPPEYYDPEETGGFMIPKSPAPGGLREETRDEERERIAKIKRATCEGCLAAAMGLPLHTVADSGYAARSYCGDAWEAGWEFINGSATWQQLAAAVAERDRLQALINSPHNDDWFEGVRIEAAHQQERWGSKHDDGKEPQDWFWLLGYLGGKCLRACIDGDTDKAKHHTISTAAVLLNWYRRISGQPGDMRPGIETPEEQVA